VIKLSKDKKTFFVTHVYVNSRYSDELVVFERFQKFKDAWTLHAGLWRGLEQPNFETQSIFFQ
jgi:hypothetical protein